MNQLAYLLGLNACSPGSYNELTASTSTRKLAFQLFRQLFFPTLATTLARPALMTKAFAMLSGLLFFLQ
ncbi:MAG: hypothetical protein R2825_17825 [Saprospiraceae bacterium]